MPNFHCHTALTAGGFVRDVRITSQDGRITGVEAGVPPVPGDERIDGIVLPGLPNLHSHAFQRGMAGLAERRGDTADDFWSWREVMYRFLGALTPDDVEAISALAFMEMVEHGFSVVGEFHYLHNDIDGRPYADPAELSVRIAAAARTAGVGLTLMPVFYAHGQFGGAPPTHGQRRFVTGLDAFARLVEAARGIVAATPDARLALAPHSLRAVTPDELRAVAALDPACPLHIHVSEQTKEVADCRAIHGTTPIALLADTVDLGPRWCLIHSTHATPDELAAITRGGAVVGLCPVTEANLGDGIFPAVDFLAAGGRFGVGTDSNILVGAAAELRALDASQRLRDRVRNPLSTGGSSGRRLHDLALAGGAQALALGTVGLVPGGRADLVVLDPGHPSLAARGGDDLVDAYVFAGAERAIRDVWIAGTRVVAGGRHVRRDAILAAWRRTMTRLAGV